MTFAILASWTARDGTRTGPIRVPYARDEAHAETLIAAGFQQAGWAGGTDARVNVVDAITWRIIKTFRDREEITMTQISGTTALAFFAGIDRAMDDAGTGQFRVQKLLTGLKEIGLDIVAVETPPEPLAEVAPMLLPTSAARSSEPELGGLGLVETSSHIGRG